MDASWAVVVIMSHTVVRLVRDSNVTAGHLFVIFGQRD